MVGGIGFVGGDFSHTGIFGENEFRYCVTVSHLMYA